MYFPLRIDGVDLPAPSGYTFTESDLVENSTRNAAGVAVWDVVRYNVGNINLTWENVDQDKISLITAAIRSKKHFEVTFLNTLTKQVETRTFYAGNRSNELVYLISALQYWSSLTVPFVEV